MNKLLKWLHDPFGNKEIQQRHTEIRRRMVETKTITESTTNYVRQYPIGHTLARRRKPIANPAATSKGVHP